jgi:uncharacterized protein
MGAATKGFASMDPEKRREICSKGGKAAHEQGRAHEFTADEARAAGRRGGKAVSSNPGHMARIGRLGGAAKNKRATERAARELPDPDPPKGAA